MDYKIKIIKAFDELDKLAGKSATEHLRKGLEGENDPSKLFLRYQALREALAEAKGQKDDVSFTVKLPSGINKKYINLKEFLSDEPTKRDIIDHLKLTRKLETPKDPE